MAQKTNPGRFFEDFTLGEEIVHATPRTVTEGDQSLYTALYGTRFAVNSSAEFARGLGLGGAPIDDLLVFHVVFGKTVPDISLNAVANLGYAGGRFGVPVFAGDTLSTRSTVIGLKPNGNGQTGVVWVRSIGRNQRGEMVLDYVRWVMVKRRAPGTDVSATHDCPPADLPRAVDAADLVVPTGLDARGFDFALSGEPHAFEDYTPGERIDHVDGMTIEEAEHQIATRLYQNTAKVHFNQLEANGNRFGRRLIYGGHIISLARSLSFNGLANIVRVAAINAGAHANPTFAGDTIHAWSEVISADALPGRTDLGALRLRLIATKNRAAADFPLKDADGKYLADVVLDLDYTVLVPRRG
jgi:2-methylfumaryl-CoA hydratase